MSMERDWGGMAYVIPLIDGMSSTLSTVLHSSDFRQSRTGNAEHLYCIVSIQAVERLRVSALGKLTYGQHDGERDEGFERDTHCGFSV